MKKTVEIDSLTSAFSDTKFQRG